MRRKHVLVDANGDPEPDLENIYEALDESHSARGGFFSARKGVKTWQ